MQFGVPRDERRWKGKEKAAAAAVEVGAETIFEERSLARSLSSSFLGCCCCCFCVLPYHQFPSCQFSSGEKRGAERRQRARAARYHFPSFLPRRRLGLLAVSNEMVVIRRNERRAAAAEEGVIYGRREGGRREGGIAKEIKANRTNEKKKDYGPKRTDGRRRRSIDIAAGISRRAALLCVSRSRKWSNQPKVQ